MTVMLLTTEAERVICDGCFKQVPHSETRTWQTTWLFPSDDDEEESEGRVDACSQECVDDLRSQGMWSD